jgi:uncharacterized YccA/Bax inhibitor family protein
MRNPALNSSIFQKEIDETDGTQAGWAAPSAGAAAPAPAAAPPAVPPSGLDTGAAPLRAPGHIVGKPMTLFGTFTATLVMFVFLLGAGVYGWNAVTQTTVQVPDPNTFGGTMEKVSTTFPSWIFLSLLVAFGLAMVTIFKPKMARITGLLYAVAEGIALGAISHAFNLQYNGIVLQAVLATMAVFASVLFLYATRIVRVTKRFTRIILGAMMGILVLYLGSAIAHLLGVNIDFFNKPTPLGIGISLLIVGVAAFSLMIDFDFIESAVAAEAPRYLEWYAAFGLMVGLVWLYLEILRLLALLRGR